jgi:hypothetical protein
MHTTQLYLPLPTLSIARSARSVIPQIGMLRIGDHVSCTSRFGAFRSCDCGSTKFTVELGRGPHATLLRCEQCGRGNRWLSRVYLEDTAS